MLLRYTSAVLLGTVATLGLLTLMHSVIADPRPAADQGIQGPWITWARVVKEHELIPKQDPPKRPDPPEKPPEPQPHSRDGHGEPLEWDMPAPVTPIGGDIVNTYMDDGTYLPIVRVQPVYPRRALTRGIEGYVLVEFVVTETGTVREPVVLVAEPPGFFERAALSAVVKYKYKPKVAGGKPVAVSGVRTRLVFELDD